MELIQIIESTVFFFSLGLLVLLTLSYLLFKVKNSTVSYPVENPYKNEEVNITYEMPSADETSINKTKPGLNERFIIVNEIWNEPYVNPTIKKRQKATPRFYIYQPGRNRIVTNLQLSRIKD